MPTNKPFSPDLRPVKNVITPISETLIRKECTCGREFMGRALGRAVKNALQRKYNGNRKAGENGALLRGFYDSDGLV